ncbi:MAG: tetratricopeptide repeat protein [Vulcanimicrobiaceae bacterium]
MRRNSSNLTICVVIIGLFTIPVHARAQQRYAIQHHAVSTHSAEAQAAFDEGLTLLYSFNREAARRSFEHATSLDKHLAMAYWGIAMTYAGNINFGSDQRQAGLGRRALSAATSLERYASAPERAYIDALRARYARGGQPYAISMRSVYRRYPVDPDAATLYAQSLMELHPWMLYKSSGESQPGTPEIVSIIATTLRRNPQHIGANHLCIHAIEAAASPAAARICADRLAAMHFSPAAAHLTHMPSHAYARVGAFNLAAQINEAAISAGKAYLRAHPEDGESAAYEVHNYAFLQYSYAAEGRYNDALRAALALKKDGFYVPQLFTYVRFDRWNDILAMPKPPPNTNELTREATWHFARGMAYASLGKSKEATRERDALRLDPKFAEIPASPGNYQAPKTIVQMARLILSARIDAAAGKNARAVAKYRQAVALQDSFLYVEPPDWYAPAREALAATLLMSGSAASAADVFGQDLRRNPGNSRSLYGLRKVLHKTSR